LNRCRPRATAASPSRRSVFFARRSGAPAISLTIGWQGLAAVCGEVVIHRGPQTGPAPREYERCPRPVAVEQPAARRKSAPRPCIARRRLGCSTRASLMVAPPRARPPQNLPHARGTHLRRLAATHCSSHCVGSARRRKRVRCDKYNTVRRLQARWSLLGPPYTRSPCCLAIQRVTVDAERLKNVPTFGLGRQRTAR
jgi:hypothetical protein